MRTLVLIFMLFLVACRDDSRRANLVCTFESDTFHWKIDTEKAEVSGDRIETTEVKISNLSYVFTSGTVNIVIRRTDWQAWIHGNGQSIQGKCK
jgi:hypothetical protein